MPDNSLLSDSTLVQLTSEPLHRFSYKDNYGSGFLNGRPGTPSSPDHSKQAISNRLEAIRMQARQRGLSLSAAKILENSTREKTSKTYQHKWSTWCNWCYTREGHPLQPNITDLIEFIVNLFDKGLAPNTINVYRSAIFSTISLLDYSSLGSHPLLSKLFNGMANLKPLEYKSPRNGTLMRYSLSFPLGIVTMP